MTRSLPATYAPGTVLHRMVPVSEVRAPEDKPGTFTANVLTYNVLDDYGTEFAPGCFDESMNERMPRICWGHDWREPLGRYTAWRAKGDKLQLDGEFDAFDDVPRARQAYAQLKSGTIDQFSVGFVPTEWQDRKVEDSDYMIRTFTKGRLDEVSLVLVGAVPDTELLSVRSPNAHPIIVLTREPLIAKEAAAAILLRLHLGEVDLADALAEVKALPAAGDSDEPPPPAPKVDEPVLKATMSDDGTIVYDLTGIDAADAAAVQAERDRQEAALAAELTAWADAAAEADAAALAAQEAAQADAELDADIAEALALVEAAG